MVMDRRIEPPLVIYVDVDNTLVKTRGDKRTPEGEMIKHVVDLKGDGVQLFCWSSLGAEHARTTAEELHIAHCFSAFLPKPHIEIDDQAISDWPYFRHFYPSQATALKAADYRQALEES